MIISLKEYYLLVWWICTEKNLYELSPFEGLEKFIGVESLQFPFPVLNCIEKVDDFQNLKTGFLCSVANAIGPNHLFVLNEEPLVLLVAQTKQAMRGEKRGQKVSGTEMADGVKTTFLPNWFSFGMDEHEKLEQKLWDFFKLKNGLVIIRMHLFYPFVEETRLCDWNSGKTKLRKCTLTRDKTENDDKIDWTEIRIDIDASCLSTSKLFPSMWTLPSELISKRNTWAIYSKENPEIVSFDLKEIKKNNEKKRK